MPNGEEYARMETEADRILYTRYKEVRGDVDDIRDRVKDVHKRTDWIIGLLVAVLGGVLFSLVQGG